MGACDCASGVVTGYSANQAYADLVEDCIYEGGNDPYSGTFSTCSLVRVHKIADKFSEKNVKVGEKMLYGLLEKGDIYKRTAHGADLGVDHYEIIRPKFKKIAGTPKVMFCVECDRDTYPKRFTTMKDAQAYALKMSVSQNMEYYVTKRYCYLNGNEKIGVAEPDVRICKSKPKKIPKNAVLREVHKYYFVGLAAC